MPLRGDAADVEAAVDTCVGNLVALLPPATTSSTSSSTSTSTTTTTMTSPALPSSMAALGDSFTTAFRELPGRTAVRSSPGRPGRTQPSIATTRASSPNPGILGHATNDAVRGTLMSALSGQVSGAVSQGPDYVTILMVASMPAGHGADMTSVSTFQSEFQAAMTSLTTGLPDAKVFVGSVPDLWRFWDIGKDNPTAVAAWASFAICGALLANPTSTAQADVDRRASFRQRIIDLNTALATVCASFGNCKFDNNAIFDHQWVVERRSRSSITSIRTSRDRRTSPPSRTPRATGGRPGRGKTSRHGDGLGGHPPRAPDRRPDAPATAPRSVRLDLSRPPVIALPAR